jgi:hypothetical protein
VSGLRIRTDVLGRSVGVVCGAAKVSELRRHSLVRVVCGALNRFQWPQLIAFVSRWPFCGRGEQSADVIGVNRADFGELEVAPITFYETRTERALQRGEGCRYRRLSDYELLGRPVNRAASATARNVRSWASVNGILRCGAVWGGHGVRTDILPSLSFILGAQRDGRL